MPPVPTSCAAIMRSVFPGPRRTTNRPSAIITSTKPAAAIRNSGIAVRTAQRPGDDGFLRGELRRDRLLDVEAVVEELPAVVAGRHRPRQQAGERGEDVAPPGGRGAHHVG